MQQGSVEKVLNAYYRILQSAREDGVVLNFLRARFLPSWVSFCPNILASAHCEPAQRRVWNTFG